MKRITGYVTVRETGIGVPNLVVTVYDSDAIVEFDRSRDGLFSLLQHAGKRVSSVLTDQSGKFLLETDDLEFQGNESRPNLLVIVFAPEDVGNPNNPFPLPPEKRVLFASAIPRMDCGAEEAFFIRLLQVQVDDLEIDTHANRLATSLGNAWKARDAIAEQLQRRLEAERQKAQETLESARSKMKRLSGIPRALRGHPLIAIGKQDLENKREEMQTKAIKDGLKQMLAVKKRPTMKLVLTKEQRDKLKLEEKHGKITGTVSFKDLFSMAGAVKVGEGLIRKRSVQLVDPAVLKARYLSSLDIVPKPDEPVSDRREARARTARRSD